MFDPLTSSTTPSSGHSCGQPARSSLSVSTAASPRHPSGWPVAALDEIPDEDDPAAGEGLGTLGRLPGCGALGGDHNGRRRPHPGLQRYCATAPRSAVALDE